MKNFARSLLTRKFLLALAAFITCVANGQYTEAVGVVSAFILAEGYGDAKEREAVVTMTGLPTQSKF